MSSATTLTKLSCIKTMSTANKNPNLAYQHTSRPKLEGKCRREAAKVWIDLAHSEARTNLINILVREGIGLSELEEFELGLVSKFRVRFWYSVH